MHKILNLICGILLVIYILYSFFLKDENDLNVIIILTVLLIISVILDKRNIKKRLIKGRFFMFPNDIESKLISKSLLSCFRVCEHRHQAKVLKYPQNLSLMAMYSNPYKEFIKLYSEKLIEGENRNENTYRAN
ncbi:hypothetical protein QUF88_00935 [Bacillus sp. DX1.1]|uniref:hypothetical protein n=1 Tax=Bacillus sp. DX1.1 TaxID=3055866 RepID=UPI0025A25F72|nr:hypothetical protein [Bacillus sp. DX1.1]MDM5152591.1 hypothetical protein [Bacillus sp. DX1.1]